MKKTAKKIMSLLLVLIISIGASIVAFAEETNKKSYEFNEKTGELRLYNDAWDKDLTTDLNIDENDVIESSIEWNFPREKYEFLLKVKSIFMGKDVSYDSDLFLYSANIEKISADINNEKITSFDNALYSKDKKTLLKCPIAREDKNVTVAEECTKFEEFAFSSINLKNDCNVTVEADNEYPNYRQKRVNLIFTKEGQFEELLSNYICGREQYIDNIYVPESQEDIDIKEYSNFTTCRSASWISTSYFYAETDENLRNQFNSIFENKHQEIMQKYSSESESYDAFTECMIYKELLDFLIEEGYADNLEDNIIKYGLLLVGKEDDIIQNCARICTENINRAIKNKDCVRNLSSFIKDSEVVNGKCGENVYYQFTRNDGLLKISGAGVMYSTDTLKGMTFTNENFANYEGISVNTANFEKFDIKRVLIESGITEISNNAFPDCINLNSVCIIPENTIIGKNAFPKNNNMQILAPKNSSVYNTLKGDCNVIPYSFTMNKDDKDKPMLALDGKVVLTEDIWSCICRLVKNADVQYIYFEELDVSKMLSSDVLEDVDEGNLKSEKVTLSIIRDGETIRLGDVEEKTSFQKIVEAVTEFFTLIFDSVITGFKGMWASIKNWWKR